jgi:hypothetical protein
MAHAAGEVHQRPSVQCSARKYYSFLNITECMVSTVMKKLRYKQITAINNVVMVTPNQLATKLQCNLLQILSQELQIKHDHHASFLNHQ